MENTYWNKNGRYQKEYNELWNLVPNKGYTDNKYINALIAISKWYYDLYNNGCCNEDVLIEDTRNYLQKVKEELNVDGNIYEAVLEGFIYTEEEPVFIYDYEEDCETDEIDYYEEVERMRAINNDDYKNFELLADAVIELCWSKCRTKSN